MYNPSIHTASNKPYGVTGIPESARYWFYDDATFTYRPYSDEAEVLSYLIGEDRRSATVQIGDVEYWFKSGILDADLVEKISTPQKKEVKKTGADIDSDGFINVSSDVDDTSDLIGAYINMRPTYSPVFFDPTGLKVGPFDTSTPSGANILLRFIPKPPGPPGPGVPPLILDANV